jgi:O-antigen/teichoic acid export membrane protein
VGGTFSMGRMGKHTAIYAVGVLVTRAASIVMLPLYTRYLTPGDYGVLELIEMTLDVIGIVAGSRLGAGVFHLYHKARDERERRAVLGSSFLLLAVAFTVAGLVSWGSAPLIARLLLGGPQHAGLVRIAALTLALNSLILIPSAELQLSERSMSVVGINLVRLGVQIGLNLLLLIQYHLGVRGVLLATLAANVAVGIPLAIRFLRHFGMTIDREAVRGIFRLGLPFIGVQLAKFAMTFGDRYFLRAVADTAAVGIYSLGYQFGFILYQVGCQPFFMAWEPARFEIAKRADRDAVFNRAFLFLNVVLLTTAVGITLFVRDFLHVAATPPFFAATRVVPIVLVAYIAQGWTSFHNYGLFAAERTEYITLANWIAAAIAIAGYAIAIPRWQMMGAAWATLLSFVASEWLVYVFAQRAHRVAYEWKPTVRLSLIAVAVCAVSQALPVMSLAPSIATHAGLLAVYAAWVWFGGVLSPSDRARLREVRLSPRALVAAVTR